MRAWPDSFVKGELMHPWQAVSGLAQCRGWIRDNASGLVESVAATSKIEPEIVLRVLDALHCQAMGGEGAGEPCLLEVVQGRRGTG